MKIHLTVAFSILAITLIFIGYENYKVRTEVDPIFLFWSVATTRARNEKLTTQDFYRKYDNLGDIVSNDALPGPIIIQRVKLSGLLCTEYSIRVYYSSRGDDSVNLMMVTGKSHGMLCFI